MTTLRDPPHPELDVEEEIDLGRYWSALLARWWLPVLGLVLGLVVGLLVSGGGERRYQAESIVYLGIQFGVGGSEALQSLPTRLATVNTLVRSRRVVNRISGDLDIDADRLRAAIEIEPVPGIDRPNVPVDAPTPVLIVRVTLIRAAAAVTASNELARTVVRGFSTLSDLKLRTYRERLRRAERELVEVNRRIDQAAQQQERLLRDGSGGLQPVEELVLLANLNNVLQFNESRQSNLEGALLTLRERVAQAEVIEKARVVERAVATREPGASRRTGAVAGALIGLVAGILAALLWEPVARRVRMRRAAA